MDVDITELELSTAIRESHADLIAALERGDALAAALTYAEHGHLVPRSAAQMDGRTAIAAYWQAGLDAGIREVHFTTDAVDGHDGLAIETGRYTLRLEPSEGDAVSDRGRYLLVHQRGPDERWRRVVEVFTPEAAGTEG
jgi:uncharacterized protein (TIGR02246 family)